MIIKVIKSDKGGKYYGWHTDIGEAHGLFHNFWKTHDIINQYTMSGSPQRFHVAKIRNRTLMDMVKSMLFQH